MAASLVVSDPKVVSWDSFEKSSYSVATEDKIYQLVLGKIIPAISLGVGITFAVLTFTASPIFLVGAVTFLPSSFILYHIFNWDADIFDRVAIFSPHYQNDQPVGIRNLGNDCWANAAIQMVMHSTALKNSMRSSPHFAPIVNQYDEAIEGKVSVASNLLGRILRQTIHSLSDGTAVGSGYSMEDPSTIFENIFGGQHAPYRYNLTVDGELSAHEPIEPYISLMPNDGAGFTQLFDANFYYTDQYFRPIVKRFATAPDCLLIKMPRYYQHNGDDGSVVVRKNTTAIPVPLQMTLQADKVEDGLQVDYECKGFIVHHGTSIHGGHYVSFIKKNDAWWFCNDSSIIHVSEEDAARAINQAFFVCFDKVEEETSSIN